MLFILKKKFEKYQGLIVKGFSHPDLSTNLFEAEGEVVGYGKNDLVVKMLNLKGWQSEEQFVYHKIDAFKEFNELGYWFVSLKEIEESILMKKRNEKMDEMFKSGEL